MKRECTHFFQCTYYEARLEGAVLFLVERNTQRHSATPEYIHQGYISIYNKTVELKYTTENVDIKLVYSPAFDTGEIALEAENPLSLTTAPPAATSWS